MIATLLLTAALASLQPPEGPDGPPPGPPPGEGGPRGPRGPGGPGMGGMNIVLPATTGNLDVRIQMGPETEPSCRSAGNGGDGWAAAATQACTEFAARAANGQRPPMAMDMIMRTVFVAAGDPEPPLPTTGAEPLRQGTLDLVIDAAGHVTRCTPVGETDARACGRFQPDRVAFLPAAEGSPARSGRITTRMYMSGPMADMIRRRQNGSDE